MLHQRRRPGADAVILDLEDAVSPQEKDAARILVRNALSLMGFSCQTVVRINALDSGLCQQDLEEIVPQGPTALMLPKTTSAQQIQQLDATSLPAGAVPRNAPGEGPVHSPFGDRFGRGKRLLHRRCQQPDPGAFPGRGGPDRRPALQAHQGREGN
ncbi:MAG: aldolase/citrate lyase family protein [Oscillospiraceae bacterium]